MEHRRWMTDERRAPGTAPGPPALPETTSVTSRGQGLMPATSGGHACPIRAYGKVPSPNTISSPAPTLTDPMVSRNPCASRPESPPPPAPTRVPGIGQPRGAKPACVSLTRVSPEPVCVPAWASPPAPDPEPVSGIPYPLFPTKKCTRRTNHVMGRRPTQAKKSGPLWSQRPTNTLFSPHFPPPPSNTNPHPSNKHTSLPRPSSIALRPPSAAPPSPLLPTPYSILLPFDTSAISV